ERLRVLEPGVHRARARRMLAQHLKIELVGPPVPVGARPVGLGSRGGDRGVLGLAGAVGVLGHGACSPAVGMAVAGGRYTWRAAMARASRGRTWISRPKRRVTPSNSTRERRP